MKIEEINISEKLEEFKKLIHSTEDDKEEDTCNYEKCGSCGGNCCRNMGCHISPTDINGDITVETISKLLDTGLVMLDWWEGDVKDHNEYHRVYYLHMRNIKTDPFKLLLGISDFDEDELQDIVYPSFGGKCILLTDKGCPLEYKHRPKGARLLIPDICFTQEGLYTKEDSCEDWRQYWDILNEVYNKYKAD